MTPLSPTHARLAGQLEDWPRQTVRLSELWQLWAAADPASAGRASRRSDLADAVAALAAVGLAKPSAATDTSARPALPLRLTLPAPGHSVTAAELARTTAWRPELSWVLKRKLSVAQVTQLRQVNVWLRDHGHEDDLIPMRERSLEVLGHEKALDRLSITTLFGPGRLTPDLLRSYRSHPPLPNEQVGDGDTLLVVENADTFHSARLVLADQPGRVGRIGWGGGGAFEASVHSVADLPGIRSVCYFGDLDNDGLRIPTNAAATAAALGLPPVEPATALYRALLACGRAEDGQPPLEGDRAVEVSSWLRFPDVTAAARDLLVSGRRVAQEALNLRLLRADPSLLQPP